MKKLLGALLLIPMLVGCFRPAIPIALPPDYPVDVYYENQRPEQAYVELKELEYLEEKPLEERQKTTRSGRMLNRGIDMEQKEILLAKMTLEAKRLGADALVSIRYQYYTTVTMNGWRLRGVAVKYQ
ncbi:hypothetical protein [Tellurirhabdus rosea]|uniref:hypothetical protein n=1 Tax=Tellurirhabdus rosea TaxID=2674997 RepID=UPI0022554935|nr:hypothetical protein [Tellurirhabdus rosea]